MAQARNVLRGIAHRMVAPPAEVLTALDQAMRDLAVGSLVTAIIAKVEQMPSEVAAGLRTFRWSNAGQPPPLPISPDGVSEVTTGRSCCGPLPRGWPVPDSRWTGSATRCWPSSAGPSTTTSPCSQYGPPRGPPRPPEAGPSVQPVDLRGR